jgi:hypothetical protein
VIDKPQGVAGERELGHPAEGASNPTAHKHQDAIASLDLYARKHCDLVLVHHIMSSFPKLGAEYDLAFKKEVATLQTVTEELRRLKYLPSDYKFSLEEDATARKELANKMRRHYNSW